MKYWVAHTRGPNFQLLEKRGFTTLFPAADDYVFLAVTEQNKPLLRRQTELNVSFLKNGNEFVTIDEQELMEMKTRSTDQIQPGKEVIALLGTCENLEGTVLNREGDLLHCRFRGFNRNYDVDVHRSEVVLADVTIYPTIQIEDLYVQGM